MLRNFLAKLAGAAAPPPAQPAPRAAVEARACDEGYRALAEGRLDAAERLLREVLEAQPDLGRAQLALGDVLNATARAEEALDCYQLAAHFAPDLPDAHIALANGLLGAQRAVEAEAACRNALALDADSAAAWLCLGNALKAQARLDEAADAYRAALAADTEFVNARQQLAFVEYRRGHYTAADAEFAALLQAVPDSAGAHHNAGLLYLETGRPEQALASFRRALALAPDTAESMACCGHALRDLGRFDEALTAYDAALRLRADFGDALSNRALTLLARGDYAAGWVQYEQRFAASGTRPRTRGASPWRGEPLAGRSIAVLSEQGLGDELMFASCLPDLLATGARVDVQCEPRLAALLARSFPAATVQARDGDAAVRPDYEISIGSLPLHFRPARNAFPRSEGYLQADPVRIAHWRAQCGSGREARRIGLSWRGGTLRNRQFLRSLALRELLPHLRVAEARLFSLQAGDCGRELAQASAECAIEVRDLAGVLGPSIDELAAAIAALDLVVTVDNTVAHLAGALGRPVWILLPFSAEWRYGRDDARLDWYTSARLFRQRAPLDWQPVLAELACALATDGGVGGAAR